MVKIEWPNGKVSQLFDVKANQNLFVDFSTVEKIEKEELIKETLFQNISSDSLEVDFVHKENHYDDYLKEPLLPHQTSNAWIGYCNCRC